MAIEAVVVLTVRMTSRTEEGIGASVPPPGVPRGSLNSSI